MEKACWAQLPRDLLSLIFSHMSLDVRSSRNITTCAAVCSTWRRVVSETCEEIPDRKNRFLLPSALLNPGPEEQRTECVLLKKGANFFLYTFDSSKRNLCASGQYLMYARRVWRLTGAVYEIGLFPDAMSGSRKDLLAAVTTNHVRSRFNIQVRRRLEASHLSRHGTSLEDVGKVIYGTKLVEDTRRRWMSCSLLSSSLAKQGHWGLYEDDYTRPGAAQGHDFRSEDSSGGGDYEECGQLRPSASWGGLPVRCSSLPRCSVPFMKMGAGAACFLPQGQGSDVSSVLKSTFGTGLACADANSGVLVSSTGGRQCSGAIFPGQLARTLSMEEELAEEAQRATAHSAASSAPRGPLVAKVRNSCASRTGCTAVHSRGRGRGRAGTMSPPESQFTEYRNVEPLWSDVRQTWYLDFGGRVSVSSVQNFQLVSSSIDSGEASDGSTVKDAVVLQCGKVGKCTYSMDFKHPISAVLAFAVAISSIETRQGMEP